MGSNHIFGPVPSRRLGMSLGVDVIPKKICSLDCVYCEVGETTQKVVARKEYVSCDRVVREIREAVQRNLHIDWITFSGSGEPTLNSSLGGILREVKSFARIPVAVITNGTLLTLEEVRRDLLEADAVLPSLDAASQEIFEQIDRPHPDLRIDSIIEGLVQFRREYRGQIWLEILFVKGINDRTGEVVRLKKAIELIQPDKVQLNTVIRPPAVSGTRPVGLERMMEIRDLLGDRCEIIARFNSCEQAVAVEGRDAILALLRRRPMTLLGMIASFGLDASQLGVRLRELELKGLVERVSFDGVEHYRHKGRSLGPRGVP
jgi:wyosine [tRNA(Phe)-imidazoG37] synthetase (radical SAM superfamily)